ncbi:GDP-mannose 4,6-dehydratase [Oceanibaculum nanhaiense]|jgi:GDPmannose 4,6-dehydratase|uniref:GDP-mannose 4,6-dehydratase n=1 Tax=Oceanibaculum nanhaiense TaxID=1909734 RepID=UPI000A3D44A7|nr:GDP-mannose 4,6-dehydratase [Oceanibaculum nanhaiense]
MKTALITGVAGQDGSYLAEFLLEQGYTVHGLARRIEGGAIWRLAPLLAESDETERRFFLHEGDILDAGFLRRLIDETQPDELYNLAGQSHVGLSFVQPARTMAVIATGTAMVLEALHAHCRASGRQVRFYQAGSSEMFGASPPPQNEDTPFHPRSPYGVAKLAAHNATAVYRDAYGLFACNGILFNHESPRRGENFVTRKVTLAAARIAAGMQDRLALGDLSVRRDWGHAADYVRAMWLMLQQEEPEDFVIATGQSHAIGELLEIAFGQAGLDWRRHVVADPACRRPLEVDHLCGDAGKAARLLGWRPTIGFEALIAEMMEADLARLGLQPVQAAQPAPRLMTA